MNESPSDASSWDADGRAEVAFREYLQRLESEGETDFDAFCAERPDLADDLARLRGEYERITTILDRLLPDGTFSDRLRARYGEGVDPRISLSGDGGGDPRPAAANGGPLSEGVLRRLAGHGAGRGRYTRRGEIARGGMGAIVEVWDEELRRTLAMKIVLGRRSGREGGEEGQVDERRLARFLEEAQITGQLDHPGIVPVHDLGIDEDGRVFFTMQLVDGRDLREIIALAREGREGWTSRRLVDVLVRVCEAMAYAHSKGVLHRDLKPGNIMVGRFGEAFVMDWGLAKVVGHDARSVSADSEAASAPGSVVMTDRAEGDDASTSSLRTLDGDIVGTPAYMAPEQAAGDLDRLGPRSDVYSIGALLYHLLAGHMPYEPLGEKVSSLTILKAVREGPPWALNRIDPEVDGELVAICEKAMARDVARRYRGMLELAADLRAYLEGREVEAYETGALYSLRKWVLRNKAVAAALAALFVLVVGSAVVFVRQERAASTRLQEELVRTEDARAEAEQSAEEALLRSREVEAANTELEAQRRRAQEQAEEAQRQERLASVQERAARLQSYRARVVAAAYSLRLDEVRVAAAHLRSVEPAMAGWEWRHLNLTLDQSVRTVLDLAGGVTDVAVDAAGGLMVASSLDLAARAVELDSLAELAHTPPAVVTNLGDISARGVRCAITPDGRLAASSAAGNLVQFVSLPDGTVLAQVPNDGMVRCLDFSPDGERLVAAARGGTTRVWRTHDFSLEAVLSGHAGAVSAVAFGPRGRRVVTGGEDGTARVMELGPVSAAAVTPRELRVLPGREGRPVTCIDWGAEGELVAVGYIDGSIGLWDTAADRLATVLHGHRGAVHAVLLDTEGDRLFSGAADMTVRVRSLGGARGERVLHGHDDTVTSLALAAGGRRLVTGSLDGRVLEWEPAWDPAHAVRTVPEPLLGAAFAAGGSELLVIPPRGSLRAWDPDTGFERLLPEQAAGKGAIEAAAVSADGRVAVVVRAGVLSVLEPGRDARQESFAATGRVRRLALSGDGTRIALHNGTHLEVRERASSEVLWRREFRRTRLSDLALDAAGRRLALVGQDEYLRVLDAADGRELWVLPNAHAKRINAVAFEPGGERLATASLDGTVRVWDGVARRLVSTLDCDGAEVTALAFHPHQARLASAARDGTLRIWDLESGNALLDLGLPAGEVAGLTFSADGERLAAVSASPAVPGAREVHVWHSRRAGERHSERVGVRGLAELLEPEVSEAAARAILHLARSEQTRGRGDDLLVGAALVRAGRAAEGRERLAAAVVDAQANPVRSARADLLLALADAALGDRERARSALLRVRGLVGARETIDPRSAGELQGLEPLLAALEAEVGSERTDAR
ncbi:MAG: protein kinase [Planctomycetota bacterium]|jgi:WD40 repeat protein/serine/threonine protein kinase|nr:protein kinase [Planctomycetota bacterium]MDP6762985.1 protein kinase [Planctomycetota bacterium]MDP6987849.1 protein kinase [Planctomycetota bacterium]